MMKNKIIVPIDFSETATNAYAYARGLAKIYNSEILLVHVEKEKRKSNKNTIKYRLEKFAEDYPKEDGTVLSEVKVKKYVFFGEAIGTIVKMAKEEEALMIVIGLKKDHPVFEKIMGSFSSVIAQQANCPVILVPEGYPFKLFRNIMYATSLDSTDPKMVKQITDFASTYLATLHFITVNKGGDENIELIEDQIFNQLFEKSDPPFAFNLASIKAVNIVKGINQYATENNIDLIVMVNKNRGLFTSISGESITHEMTFSLKHPMMVYHSNGEV